MAKPDTLIVDGHALSWQHLCDLRRQQIETWKKAEGRQPALFELRDDHRPITARTAAGRYLQPSLFDNQAAQARQGRP
jgi:hypothetical protein